MLNYNKVTKREIFDLLESYHKKNIELQKEVSSLIKLVDNQKEESLRLVQSLNKSQSDYNDIKSELDFIKLIANNFLKND